MNFQWMAVLGAALFFAVKMGWIKWPPVQPQPATDKPDKPITAADLAAVLKDHGLECKTKPPEVVQNADGSVTIKGLPPAT